MQCIPPTQEQVGIIFSKQERGWAQTPTPPYPICLPAVQVTCASPPALRGQEIAALDSQDLGCQIKQRFARELNTTQPITVTENSSKFCRFRGDHKVIAPSCPLSCWMGLQVETPCSAPQSQRLRLLGHTGAVAWWEGGQHPEVFAGFVTGNLTGATKPHGAQTPQ